MLARWPSKQDCKEDMGELIASLCTKCSVSDLRAHKNGKITSDIRTWISLCGVWQCRGPRVPLPGQREEIKEVTWGNLLWYRGLNWKLCFLSWIHISSWRAPAIILLAFPGGYRSYLLDRCVLLGVARLILMSCQELCMCGPKSRPLSSRDIFRWLADITRLCLHLFQGAKLGLRASAKPCLKNCHLWIWIIGCSVIQALDSATFAYPFLSLLKPQG